jgi:hypothetical protein
MRRVGLEMKTGRSGESLARFLLRAIQMVDGLEEVCCQGSEYNKRRVRNYSVCRR